jgi:hypothetical protein
LWPGNGIMNLVIGDYGCGRATCGDRE